MRCFDQGSCFRVTVSADEVREWKRSWPASGLRSTSKSFTFDKRNGDLVDHNATESEDGSALAALSEDAQKHGKATLAAKRAKPKRNPRELSVRVVEGAPAAPGKHYVVKLPRSSHLDRVDPSWAWVKGDGHGQAGFWVTRKLAAARALAPRFGISIERR